MILLTISDHNKTEKEARDFHVVHATRPEQMLGLNIIAILQIDQADSRDMIEYAESRMLSRLCQKTILHNNKFIIK